MRLLRSSSDVTLNVCAIFLRFLILSIISLSVDLMIYIYFFIVVLNLHFNIRKATHNLLYIVTTAPLSVVKVN